MSARGEMVTSVMLAAGAAGRRDDWRATAAPAANAAAARAAAAAGRHGERSMKDLMVGLGRRRRSSGDRLLIVVVRRGSCGRGVKSQHFFVSDQSGVRSCVCGLHCREKGLQRRVWIRWLETHERRRQRASRDDRRGIELPGGARGHEHQPSWHPCRSVAANFAYQQCQKSAELRHAGLDAWRQMHFSGAVEPDVLRSERHVRRLDRVDRYSAAQLPDERSRVIRGERH